jgi:hypothetical protein
MANYPVCFDHMLAAWNETQPEAIRVHLNLSLAEDVMFIDPTILTTICFATAGRYAKAARC